MAAAEIGRKGGFSDAMLESGRHGGLGRRLREFEVKCQIHFLTPPNQGGRVVARENNNNVAERRGR